MLFVIRVTTTAASIFLCLIEEPLSKVALVADFATSATSEKAAGDGSPRPSDGRRVRGEGNASLKAGSSAQNRCRLLTPASPSATPHSTFHRLPQATTTYHSLPSGYRR